MSLLFSCIHKSKTDDCEKLITFPPGGIDYPSVVNNEDIASGIYQIKDSLHTRDSFIAAYTSYHFLKSFDEVNLSIKPHPEILFRISYESFGDYPFVLTMSCNKMTLKIGTTGDPSYPTEDTNRLSETERLHYRLLGHYPVRLNNISPSRKAYLDSLLRIYPNLLSPSYHRYILEKSLNFDSLPFKYSKYEVNITEEKFLYFTDLINKSGFWDMPFRISYEPSPMDGGGYLLEANTPKKFKVVISSNCPEATKKLTEACQEMIELVKPNNKKMRLCG